MLHSFQEGGIGSRGAPAMGPRIPKCMHFSSTCHAALLAGEDKGKVWTINDAMVSSNMQWAGQRAAAVQAFNTNSREVVASVRVFCAPVFVVHGLYQTWFVMCGSTHQPLWEVVCTDDDFPCTYGITNVAMSVAIFLFDRKLCLWRQRLRELFLDVRRQ